MSGICTSNLRLSRANSLPAKTLRVGLDIDDVIGDFTERFLFYAAMLFGTPREAQPRDWEWSNILTEEQVNVVWQHIDATPNFWLTLPSRPNVKRLTELVSKTHTTFITNRKETGVGLKIWSQTSLWLAEILEPSIDLETWGLRVTSEKGKVASELKLDFFLDDRPKNCQMVRDAVPACRVYLMDSAHNQGINEFPRVNSLDEFAGIVLEGK